MRIVIIGEFSSFSKNLSKGFRLLGHECFVFSWGDGFKKIEQDGDSYSVITPSKPKKLPFGMMNYILTQYKAFLKLRKQVAKMSDNAKWDVALVLNPGFIKRRSFLFFWEPKFTKKMVLSLLTSPDKVFLSACGADVPYCLYWNKQNWKNKALIQLLKKSHLSSSEVSHFRYCATFINRVIPVMYDYAQAWRNLPEEYSFIVYPTIPLPVDITQYEAFNTFEDKIVILHGIIRPEAKGTKYIVAAMNKLQANYPDQVICKAEGGLPFSEYAMLLMRANILIDQVYAGSSGMNALYALAMGKVLLGGNEPENAIEYKYSNIPIINIGPDEEDIYSKLEELVLQPEVINKLSLLGRKYVEAVHDCRVVAEAYLDAFTS